MHVLKIPNLADTQVISMNHNIMWMFRLMNIQRSSPVNKQYVTVTQI